MLPGALERVSLVEQVEERILDTIRASGAQVGDSLPSEIELTASLGVSRTIVREALSRLRGLGLIESRKKRGMVLCEPDVFAGSQVMDSAFLNQETQKDLAEMRLILEMGLADLLFARKTDGDIADLLKIVEAEERAKTEKTRLKQDVAFHGELYRIAGNPLMVRFQSMLQPFFERAARERHERGSGTHRDLLEELASGTPEGFRAVMRAHLAPYFTSIEKDQK